jgi:hypothetical protein
MKAKLVVPALLLMATAAASNASAQNVNSDWSLGGGTGIGRHATGFSGTSGDPDLYSGTSRPPTLRDYGPGPAYGPPGTRGGPGYMPAAPGYAPPSGAPLEYYTPPSRR